MGHLTSAFKSADRLYFVGASIEEPNDEGHETHDSISLRVRALQYVRACKNGSSYAERQDPMTCIGVYRCADQVFLHPNYGNPDGATSVSAGGLMWNGRSASEWGGG